VQCYANEASVRNNALVGGQVVELEKDVSETDRYGRLLRYVYVGGRMVNEILVREGYARASSYPPDVKYQESFSAAEREARSTSRGLWLVCAGPNPTLTAAPAPSATRAPATSCDASYPDVCIAPPPPDLNCPDVPYRRFVVRQPDPHGFDGDRNGIGCQ
jgi:micrococcal nuclease